MHSFLFLKSLKTQFKDECSSLTLLNFTFDQPAEVQFLKFDLVSFWGTGGGLQYFPNHKWQQSTGALPLFPRTFYTLIIAALAFL